MHGFDVSRHFGTKPKIEKVFCDFCRKDNYRPLGDFTFQNTTLTLVKCLECKMIYVNPRLTIEQRNLYFQQYMKGSEEDAIWWKEYRDPNFKVDLKLLKRFSGKGKLLEIGCGYGFFLKEVEKLGWDGYGIEVSKDVCRYARQKLDVDVSNCTLEETDFPFGYFDAVTLLDVIGYLQSPSHTLSEINRILKGTGTVLIRTLDRISYMKAYNTLMRLFGKSEALENNPFFENDRNYHFSAKSLKKLLLAAGFCRIKIFNTRLGYWPQENQIIRGLRHCFMFFTDFVWFVSAGKICLAPSITVVAKKKSIKMYRHK